MIYTCGLKFIMSATCTCLVLLS